MDEKLYTLTWKVKFTSGVVERTRYGVAGLSFHNGHFKIIYDKTSPISSTLFEEGGEITEINMVEES